MGMSLLGILSVLLSLAVFIKIIRLRKAFVLKRRFLAALFVLVLLQAGSVAGTGMYWILALALVLGVVYFSTRYKKQAAAILCSLLILTAIYTEFFNGVFTFENKSKFFEVHSKVKQYHWLFPVKVYEEDNGQMNIYSLQLVTDHSIPRFHSLIELEDGVVYYYRSTGGFGEMNGYWYEYGTERMKPGQI
jgi:hypothetical protein